MKYLLAALFFTGLWCTAISQDPLSARLDALNRFIDHAVVKKDQKALDTLYADDFYFTHGNGHIDNKASWLKGVMDPQMHYISREHDSTVVEPHSGVAMIYGKLTIIRKTDNGQTKYAIKYVRVFSKMQDRWCMISHRTVQQWDNLP
jgi:ketosteroid isomerase-like protein